MTLTSQGCVCVTVRDTGAGMTNEQIGALFSEGVQFDALTLQNGQGSGLGLYISKGIVELHGGAMFASSGGIGQGSMFTVLLPLEHDASGANQFHYLHCDEQAQPISVQLDPCNTVHTYDTIINDANNEEMKVCSSDVTNAMTTAHTRLLIVDDAKANRTMLSILLSSKGYACAEASDGAKVVELYRDYCARHTDHSVPFYDVIVMDFEMPVLSGPAAVQQLRALGCASLVVGVTGNLLAEDVAVFQSSGADVVLAKPFNLSQFQRACDDHFGNLTLQ